MESISVISAEDPISKKEKWKLLVKINKGINGKSYGEVGIEWHYVLVQWGCYVPLIAKLIATFEIEKAEGHLMDMIKPEEVHAETSVGQRMIPHNTIDVTVPKDLQITINKEN